MAVVSGRLQIRTYTDKDGNNRRAAEIVADNVYFGDSKQATSEASVAPSAYTAPASNFAMLDDTDSALPF
jgi:single-strand DNA-binding protein